MLELKIDKINNMEKILYVKIDSTDREGKPLVSAKGYSYSRQTLKVESKGDRYISGFLNEATKGFAVGDEVDILITESDKLDKNGKPYLNWSLPKKGEVDNRLLKDVYDNTETILNRIVTLTLDLQIIKDKLNPKKDTYPANIAPQPFPEEDEDIDDIVPF